MTTTTEELHVLIPCLNEEATIRGAVLEVLAHAPKLPMPVRITMIDDGSTDRTRQIMEQLAEEHEVCEVIVNPRNLGLGRSVTNAYERIPDGAWVTVFPGDKELVFGASVDNFMAVRHEYDLILGYLQNTVVRTFTRRLASYAFSKVTATLYGFPWRYLNGLKMYKVEVFRGIEVVSGGHAYMAEMVAKAQLRRPDLRIGQAAFVSRGRKAGESRAFTSRSVSRAVREVYNGSRSVSEFRKEVVQNPPPLSTDEDS